jgi:hypothetical protein
MLREFEDSLSRFTTGCYRWSGKLARRRRSRIGGRGQHGVDVFRSIDVNAPLPQSNYTLRPNSNYAQIRQMQSEGAQEGAALDINYRGRFNRWFNAFAWYSWSHYENNTSGIYFFPENQQDPEAEWGRADWDTRQRFGVFGEINSEHLLNLGFGVFAHSGAPYTITTGTDAYGDNLYNTRPEGVAPQQRGGARLHRPGFALGL